MPDFISNSLGQTVTSDQFAMAVIRRQARRILDDDSTPPVATPALPPVEVMHV